MSLRVSPSSRDITIRKKFLAGFPQKRVPAVFNLPTAIISRIIAVCDMAKRNRSELKSQWQKRQGKIGEARDRFSSRHCETVTLYRSRTRPLSAGQRINRRLCPVCYSVMHDGRRHPIVLVAIRVYDRWKKSATYQGS